MHEKEWISAAHSTIGTVRKSNEDDFLEASQAALWCVADGMGGHNKGDLASRLITECLTDLDDPDNFPIEINAVNNRLNSVNQQLLELAGDLSASSVIGSTVAILIFGLKQAHCLWAGDSRIYRLRAGELERLTRDHSQVEDMVVAGILTAEEAERHPAANVITRAVGAHSELDLEVRSFNLELGDVFLLCTDGLNKVIDDLQIQQILIHQPLENAAEVLIQHALTAQARDNVTAIVVRYGRSELPTGFYNELDETRPLRA